MIGLSNLDTINQKRYITSSTPSLGGPGCRFDEAGKQRKSTGINNIEDKGRHTNCPFKRETRRSSLHVSKL